MRSIFAFSATSFSFPEFQDLPRQLLLLQKRRAQIMVLGQVDLRRTSPRMRRANLSISVLVLFVSLSVSRRSSAVRARTRAILSSRSSIVMASFL
jgi:hypothetical protein